MAKRRNWERHCREVKLRVAGGQEAFPQRKRIPPICYPPSGWIRPGGPKFQTGIAYQAEQSSRRRGIQVTLPRFKCLEEQ